MCDDSIDPEQVEAMRRAFAELRAAAQRLLACAGDLTGGAAGQALAELRAASAVDPAGFVVEAPPMHRMVLRLPSAAIPAAR